MRSRKCDAGRIGRVRVSDLRILSLRCATALSAEGRAKEKKTMLLIALSIVTLASTLVACGYVAKGALELDAGLNELLEQQSEWRRCVEEELARVRQSATELERG